MVNLCGKGREELHPQRTRIRYPFLAMETFQPVCSLILQGFVPRPFFMKVSRFSLCLFCYLAWHAFAGESPAPHASHHQPLLPRNLRDGISPARPSEQGSSVADSANAALLKEYGFTDFESGTYTRDDGRKLDLKAIRFADASGAYGAFTYYKMPQMLKESIPDQGCVAERAGAVLSRQHPGGRGLRQTDRHVRRRTPGLVASAAVARGQCANLPILPHIFRNRVT